MIEKDNQALELPSDLKELQEQLDFFVNCASSGYWNWDLRSGKESITSGFWKSLGYSQDDPIAQECRWREIIYSEDLKRFNFEFANCAKSDLVDSFKLELRFKRKDGSSVWMMCHAKIVNRDSDRSPLRLRGCFSDVSAYKLVDADLEMKGRLSLFGEMSPTAMIMVDDKGVIVLMNHQCEVLFGYSRAELIGQPMEILIPHSARKSHEASRKRFSEDPRIRPMGSRGQQAGLRKDGTEIALEIGLNPTYTASGTFVVASMIDLSERIKAAERFRESIEVSPNAIIIVDKSGKIHLVNERAVALFERAREELINQPINILLSGTSIQEDDRVVEFLSRITPESSLEPFEASLRASNSRIIPVEMWKRTIRIDNTPYNICAISDITSRKQLLEREQLHAKELERSNQELDKFAYVASHDLKAPLRAIDHLSKWIFEDVGDALPETARGHLTQMRQRVARLEKLLDDLLAYSRAGRVDNASSKIELNAFLFEIVHLFHAESAVKITIDAEPITFEAKKVPLGQVIRNLIDNAIKHHDKPDGVITVKAERVGNVLNVSVSDDGPGIAPEYHNRIFEMFKTLRPRDEVEGSGMGLAMVKKLVESEGGAVMVQSVPGQGSSFSFSWPLSH